MTSLDEQKVLIFIFFILGICIIVIILSNWLNDIQEEKKEKKRIYKSRQNSELSRKFRFILAKDCQIPQKKRDDSIGYEIFLPVDQVIPKGITKIDTGIRMAIPEHFYGCIKSLPSLRPSGITCEEVLIESNDRMEISVYIHNDGKGIEMKKGEPICQILFQNIPHTPRLHKTDTLKIPREDLSDKWCDLATNIE